MALYRKYRPKNFDDIYGQKYIVNIIKKSVIANKFSHAYLFSGSRGTGKTSMAKIIAKAVNCENLKNGVTCDKCNSCTLFDNRSNPDVVEIDAASNNGIDEIRTIRDKVALLPAVSKYKVYIIDEVHMLTTQAFNALLKTLEEPPSHVIFILATTELYKVPETIVSRCQCFEFKKVPDLEVISCLTDICKKEKIKVEEGVLELIAKYSDGGLRDSIGLLDKLCSCADSITVDVFYDVMGIIDDENIKKIISYVVDADVSNLFNTIELMEKNGKSIRLLIKQIMEFLKGEIVKIDDLDLKRKYVDILVELNDSYSIFNYSNDVLINFEVVLLKIVDKFDGKIVQKDGKSKEIESDIKKNTEEKKVEEIKESESKIEQLFVKEKENSYFDVIINNAFALADKGLKNEIIDKWSGLYDYVHNREFSNVVSYFLDSSVQVVGKKDIIISTSSEAIIGNVAKNLPKMELLLNLVTGKFYNIAFVSDDQWTVLREKYIEDINNGKKYEYIEINDKNNDIIKEEKDDSEAVSIAKDIFGEDVVEVK